MLGLERYAYRTQQFHTKILSMIVAVSLSLSLCACSCVCLVHVCVCVHMEASILSPMPLSVLLHFFWNRVSHQIWKSPIQHARQPMSCRDPPVATSASASLVDVPVTLSCSVALGSKSRSSCLSGKHLIY